ncbi:MAG: nuclease [Deltaproteobacteria bacterium]|nr:nuclease [Deltaproteobacteria bacterium]
MNRTLVCLVVLSLLTLPGCKKTAATSESGASEAPEAPEAPEAAEVADAVWPPEKADAEAAGLDPKWPTILLNGELTSVRWSDGDSFKFKSGAHTGKGVRLMGYNTLESYGPVHRWGSWTAVELYRIAKASWRLGAAATWTCSASGEEDHYGRLLVDCPDAARYIIEQGHGMIFAIEGESEDALLRAQRMAMKSRVGMWEKGAPKSVITSLHSADEGEEKSPTYNRVVDTVSGAANEAPHKSSYDVCEEVCIGGDDGSCMVYVPFSQRYKNKAECLYVKEKGSK